MNCVGRRWAVASHKHAYTYMMLTSFKARRWCDSCCQSMANTLEMHVTRRSYGARLIYIYIYIYVYHYEDIFWINICRFVWSMFGDRSLHKLCRTIPRATAHFIRERNAYLMCGRWAAPICMSRRHTWCRGSGAWEPAEQAGDLGKTRTQMYINRYMYIISLI